MHRYSTTFAPNLLFLKKSFVKFVFTMQFNRSGGIKPLNDNTPGCNILLPSHSIGGNHQD